MSNRDNILVIDIEMTCEESKIPNYEPEIIQIGIVELNHRGEFVKEYMRYVKPTVNRISDFCTKLTGITPKHVKSAPNLKETLNSLTKIGIKNKRIVFWGHDNIQFEEECNRKTIDFKLSSNTINLSLVHSIMCGIDNKIKLNDALRTWGVEPEGNAHDALVDARNTAKILQTIMNSSPVRIQ